MTDPNITSPGKPELIAAIGQDMAAHGGRITFARYMQLALYHPAYGYYLGPRRDYQTSAQVHPLFGDLLARQLLQIWELIHQPDPFQVIEMGAGGGQLATAIWHRLRRLAPALPLEYTAIDVCARPSGLPCSIKWSKREPLDWHPESIFGCVISNELIDAMPVHLVEMRDGRLREVYVEPNPLAGNGQPAAEPFREVLGEPSRAAIEEHFRWLGLTLPEGHRAEVNLNARRWMASVAEAMAMGFVITIDYGAPAEELLARAPGTLMCYHRQQYNNHPFSRVGEQDITAHVDFSALVEAGKEEGLMLAGLVTQADFLRNLGLAAYERQLELDRASGRITAAQMYDRRSVLRELVDPRSLGAFRVLVQHTGVDCPILDGLNPTNPRKRALWVDPPRWEW